MGRYFMFPTLPFKRCYSTSIVVQECGVPCECQYSQNGMCDLMGCSRITLWDEIICKITHLFE